MAYTQVTGHPKFADLSAILGGRPKFVVLGLLEAVWNFTALYSPQGDVGKFPDRQIEAWIEWDGEPGTLITALIASRWIDTDSEHRLIIHDWHEHAPEYVKKRIKRANLAFCIAKRLKAADSGSRCPDSGREIENVAASGCPPNLTIPNHTQPNPTERAWSEPTRLESVTSSIIEKYPKGVSQNLLATKILSIVGDGKGEIYEAVLRKLETNTLAWCEEWRKKPNFAPNIVHWLGDGGWEKPPPAPANSPTGLSPEDIAACERGLARRQRERLA